MPCDEFINLVRDVKFTYMGKEKYYTPSIEEFFVGFQYEVDYGNNNWVKESIDFAPQVVTLPYMRLDNIRVKYLDSSDIEEFLNIKPKLGESYIFLKDVNFRPNWLIGVYAHKIRIFFNPLTKWLKVEYLLTGNEEFEKFFEGSVKNKSEFIKLLRFLGYE